MYYSTGKSPYLKKVGTAVETDEATAQILIKKGFITDMLEDLVVEKVETVETPVEHTVQKQLYKPKGRPKRK